VSDHALHRLFRVDELAANTTDIRPFRLPLGHPRHHKTGFMTVTQQRALPFRPSVNPLWFSLDCAVGT